MSAYVNRLLDRFAPATGADAQAQVNPFIRSHSPIAQFDQRPGLDDSSGLDGFAAAEDSPELAVPDLQPAPARIQRKATAQTVPASPVASAPSTPAVPGASAALAPAPVPAQPATLAAPTTVIAAPRREPMDPGPLFDPFSRAAVAGDATISSPPSPSAPVSSSASPDLRAPTPAITPTPTPRVRPLDPVPSRVVELRRPVEALAPWRPLEREAPPTHPLVTPAHPREQAPARPILAPALEPDPRPSPVHIVHIATPRPPAPTPYVPDPGPRVRASLEAAQARALDNRAPTEAAPRPASPPTRPENRTPRPPRDIDSISQIGPLSHHFPNRRRLRLRYR